MFGVGRDLCGSSSPTPLPKQGHLQQDMTSRTGFQSSLQGPGTGDLLLGEFQQDDGTRELSMAKENFTGALHLILNRSNQYLFTSLMKSGAV